MYVRLAKKLIKYIYNPTKNQRNLFKNDMHTNIFLSVLTTGMWLESSSEKHKHKDKYGILLRKTIF